MPLGRMVVRPPAPKVLLVLPIGMDEALLLHRFDFDVLSRRGFPPPTAINRRVALYAGTRMGNRDFFGAANRKARDRHLRTLSWRIREIFSSGYPVDSADVAPFAQRVVATAVIEGAGATSTSPWWDKQNTAWQLADIKRVVPALPLDPGPASGGFRTVEDTSDIAQWLRSCGAIGAADLGPFIPTRRRS